MVGGGGGGREWHQNGRKHGHRHALKLCCAVSAGRGRTGPLPAVCWTHPAAVEQWGGPRSTLTNWSCVCATRQCARRTAGCGLGVLFPLCAVTAVQVSFVSPMCGLSVPNAGLKRNTFVCVTTKKGPHPARHTWRSDCLMSTSTSSTSGNTATATVEVWSRPPPSVNGIRCTCAHIGSHRETQTT